jgi:elongator complex protein 1
MSAYQLSLDQSVNATRPHQSPTHVSFSANRDVLALLWDSGYIELWNLNIRLGSGGRKIMDPVQVWAWDGPVSEVHSRQVALWNINDHEVYVVVLRSEKIGVDAVTVMQIVGEEKKRSWCLKMPQRNGRLLDTDQEITWQARNGEIFDGKFTTTSLFV